jgi:ATP-dependent DNA ligase
LARLRSLSRIIEAIACDDNGVTSFNLVRYRHHDESIFLYAFDLIELNGDDLRRDPLEGRKTTLEMILAKAGHLTFVPLGDGRERAAINGDVEIVEAQRQILDHDSERSPVARHWRGRRQSRLEFSFH